MENHQTLASGGRIGILTFVRRRETNLEFFDRSCFGHGLPQFQGVDVRTVMLIFAHVSRSDREALWAAARRGAEKRVYFLDLCLFVFVCVCSRLCALVCALGPPSDSLHFLKHRLSLPPFNPSLSRGQKGFH